MTATENRAGRKASPKIQAPNREGPVKMRVRMAAHAAGRKGASKIGAVIGMGPGQGKSHFLGLYRAEPLKIIELIKGGIDASEAKELLVLTKKPLADTLEALDLPQSTFNRKAKNEQALTTAESERFVGFAKLIGQVEAMVEESGDPEEFDAPAWVARWLEEPLPALGGERPLDLLDTMEGQALVAATLARVQSGAYA
jgi:putative toxin-antitoxin system antitoxin component (TIGR02293 family)